MTHAFRSLVSYMKGMCLNFYQMGSYETFYFYFRLWFASTWNQNHRVTEPSRIWFALEMYQHEMRDHHETKQDGYDLFLSCINIEMQDHHETKQERTYFIFELYQHGMRDPMRPKQGRHILILELYQHGMWDHHTKTRKNILLFLNCINMKSRSPWDRIKGILIG